MRFLGRQYARRIVNVNVNIVAAGLLALGPLTLTIYIATRHLGLTNKLAISALTFTADLIYDVIIYYALHWLANHSPLRRLHPERPARPSFFRDASLVQFERAILSPILYTVAIGLQQWLMHDGMSPERATAISFSIGILVSRVLHTGWMVWTGRTE
jgi:hypothetical protein